MINLSHTDHRMLVSHLYTTLIKDFFRFYRALPHTENDSKAVTAIIRGLQTSSPDEKHDKVVTFISYKLPALLDKNPITLDNYLENQSLILNSFKNMLINQWKHNNVEHKHITSACELDVNTNTKEEEMINLLENIPDTRESYDTTIDQVWEIWTAYVKTLSGSQKMLSLFFIPGSKVGSPQLAKMMGKPERTIRYQIQKLEEGFRAYLKANHSGLVND